MRGLVCTGLAWCAAGAQGAEPAPAAEWGERAVTAGPERPGDAMHAPAAAVEQWRAWRFGIFVHWGVASLTGGELSVTRDGRFGGLDGVIWHDIAKVYQNVTPAAEYDQLYRKFDPQGFDAEAWVKLFGEAGARYMVFVTKHPDGFCMFDSDLTDYKITNTPFGRDVAGELAKACGAAGMPLGFYYSPADWRHPDYRTENHARYVEYLHGHVRELLTKYPPVAVMWFDDIWAPPEDWDAVKLERMVRELQPNILINNRAGLPGDYETPEGEIGGPRAYEHFPSDVPWETCRTLGTQWGWKPNDVIPPLKDCLGYLIRCAGQDGNLLLNVAPGPDGTIDAAQTERLHEMGAWLKTNGESIYGTRGGPYRDGAWGTSTHKGNTIYLHVLDWKAKYLYMPPTGKKVLSARLMNGKPVQMEETPQAMRFEVAEGDRDALDTLIVLELDGPAGEIRPRHPARVGFLDGDLP